MNSIIMGDNRYTNLKKKNSYKTYINNKINSQFKSCDIGDTYYKTIY